MIIASIQMQIHDDSKKAESIARAEELIDEAGPAELIVLPEIWNIGYFSFDRYVSESETAYGETITRMRAKALEKDPLYWREVLLRMIKINYITPLFLLDLQGTYLASIGRSIFLDMGLKRASSLKRAKMNV